MEHLEGVLKMIDYKMLLEDCKDEVLRLRHTNEILYAKIEMVELMKEFLFARPMAHTMVGMGENIERRIDEAITELSKALQDSTTTLNEMDKKTTPTVNVGGVGGSDRRETEDRYS